MMNQEFARKYEVQPEEEGSCRRNRSASWAGAYPRITAHADRPSHRSSRPVQVACVGRQVFSTGVICSSSTVSEREAMKLAVICDGAERDPLFRADTGRFQACQFECSGCALLCACSALPVNRSERTSTPPKYLLTRQLCLSQSFGTR